MGAQESIEYGGCAYHDPLSIGLVGNERRKSHAPSNEGRR